MLDRLPEHAARICEAQIVDIITVEDGKLHYAAEVGEFARMPRGIEPPPLNRESVMGHSIVDKQSVHVADLQSADHDFPLGREFAFNSAIEPRWRCRSSARIARLGRSCSPRRGTSVRGQAHRAAQDVRRPGRDRDRECRLLNELRQRTDDLSESLEQQTATTDIPHDQPSGDQLEAGIRRDGRDAIRICDARLAYCNFNGEVFHTNVMQCPAAPTRKFSLREPTTSTTEVRPGRARDHETADPYTRMRGRGRLCLPQSRSGSRP